MQVFSQLKCLTLTLHPSSLFNHFYLYTQTHTLFSLCGLTNLANPGIEKPSQSLILPIFRIGSKYLLVIYTKPFAFCKKQTNQISISGNLQDMQNKSENRFHLRSGSFCTAISHLPLLTEQFKGNNVSYNPYCRAG